MSKTYGEMIADLVDCICKFDDRAAVMRRNDIPKGHFYNVINPNRETTAGNPFYAPIEWMVKLTRDAKNYCMLKRVAKDCDCILITPEDVKELQSTDPSAALEVINKVLGLVNRKK